MSKETGKSIGFALQVRHRKSLVSILRLGGALELNKEAFNGFDRVKKQSWLTFIRTTKDSHPIVRKISTKTFHHSVVKAPLDLWNC